MAFRFENGNGNGDVAGEMESRRRNRCCKGNGNGNGNGDVAGEMDRIRPVKVRIQGVINGEDLCRAVRRCLINDLVAGVQDENDDDDRHHHHHCGCRRGRN